MAVVIRSEGEVTIVELSGEFTLGRGGVAHPLDLQGRRIWEMRQTLRALLDRNRTRIVLDVDKVRVFDSAGLGELVAWKKRAAELGGDLRFLHVHGQVDELFEMTALTRVFRIFDTEADAVASFRPEQAP